MQDMPFGHRIDRVAPRERVEPLLATDRATQSEILSKIEHLWNTHEAERSESIKAIENDIAQAYIALSRTSDALFESESNGDVSLGVAGHIANEILSIHEKYSGLKNIVRFYKGERNLEILNTIVTLIAKDIEKLDVRLADTKPGYLHIKTQVDALTPLLDELDSDAKKIARLPTSDKDSVTDAEFLSGNIRVLENELRALRLLKPPVASIERENASESDNTRIKDEPTPPPEMTDTTWLFSDISKDFQVRDRLFSLAYASILGSGGGEYAKLHETTLLQPLYFQLIDLRRKHWNESAMTMKKRMRMYPPESTNPIEREFTLEEVLRAAFELHKQATRAAIEKHPEAKKSFVRETLLTPDPFIHDRRDAYLAYLNSVQKR